MAYLAQTLHQTAQEAADRPWAVAILAAFWAEVQTRYGSFLLSDPVWLMTAVWAADFVLGSSLAIRASWQRAPVGRWSPRKAAQSIGKWLLWICVLFVCYALRQSGRFGFGPFAALIESAIILAEATSALRNAGRLTGARWLDKFASAGEDAIDHLAERAEQSAEALHSNGRSSAIEGAH